MRIGGRSEELGRPFFYSTTRRFLQVFGLRHLDELPRADDLRARQPQGAGGHELPETQSPETAFAQAVLTETLSGNEPFPDLTFQKVSTEESEVTIAADPELAPLQELDEERTLVILAPRGGPMRITRKKKPTTTMMTTMKTMRMTTKKTKRSSTTTSTMTIGKKSTTKTVTKKRKTKTTTGKTMKRMTTGKMTTRKKKRSGKRRKKENHPPSNSSGRQSTRGVPHAGEQRFFLPSRHSRVRTSISPRSLPCDYKRTSE